MSRTANELAQAIMDTHEAREASWDKAKARYGLTFEQAALKAGIAPAIMEPVVAMLGTGYVDFPEWAEATLKRSRGRDR